MSKPVPIRKPVLGVDMLSDETSLVPGSVRSAYDVDIDRTGNYGRRPGYYQALPGNWHSVYSAPQKGVLLAAKDSVLTQLSLGLGGPTTTVTGTPLFQLQSDDPVVYTELNGNLYFSNRTTVGWIPSNSRAARPLGVPPLDPAPDLSASLAGPYLPGRYSVVVSLVDDRGEESATTTERVVELPAGGGIKLSNLHIPSGTFARVYVTAPDGEVFYKCADIPNTFTEYLVTEQPSGSPLNVQFLIPMPPGDFICWHGGRLYTARDGAVRFSQTYNPGLHDPAHGVIPFSGHISLLERVSDGLYIGDSRGVWFLAGGDPTDVRLTLVSTCRAVRGSAVVVPGEHLPEKEIGTDLPVPVWLSTSGYTVGLPGGTTKELHPDRVRVPAGMTGKSAFMIRNGRKQVVTAVNFTTTQGLGVAEDSSII